MRLGSFPARLHSELFGNNPSLVVVSSAKLWPVETHFMIDLDRAISCDIESDLARSGIWQATGRENSKNENR